MPLFWKCSCCNKESLSVWQRIIVDSKLFDSGLSVPFKIEYELRCPYCHSLLDRQVFACRKQGKVMLELENAVKTALGLSLEQDKKGKEPQKKEQDKKAAKNSKKDSS